MADSIEDLVTSLDLERVVLELNDEQAAIVSLRQFRYTQQDIATLLNISRARVWAQEHAAYAALGTRLEEILGTA